MFCAGTVQTYKGTNEISVLIAQIRKFSVKDILSKHEQVVNESLAYFSHIYFCGDKISNKEIFFCFSQVIFLLI